MCNPIRNLLNVNSCQCSFVGIIRDTYNPIRNLLNVNSCQCSFVGIIRDTYNPIRNLLNVNSCQCSFVGIIRDLIRLDLQILTPTLILVCTWFTIENPK